MGGNARTWSTWLSAASQGAIQHVQCVSPVYRGPARRVCTRVHAPPLINTQRAREPAILVATPRGAVPAGAMRRPPWTVEAPWGDRCPGYCVPVARYGLIRSYCRAGITSPGIVVLTCQGEPDREALRPLLRAATRVGARIEVAQARLYTVSDALRIAGFFAAEARRRGRYRVVLPAGGLAHLAAAAVYIAVERLGLEPWRDIYFDPLFGPDLGSMERNRLKIASDYMCSRGDPVACMASRALHAPLWPVLAGIEEV